MRTRVSSSSLFLTLFFSLVILCSGCPSKPDYPGTGGSGESTEEEVLLEPFDAPALEELDAKVKWEDRPVYSAMEKTLEEQAKEKPLATVEEALKLKNVSNETNEKILSAMGQLPKSDSVIDYDAEINRLLPADIKSSNPVMGSSTYEFWVTGLTGFGLFGIDRVMDPFAPSEVVVSWQTSEDKLYDKVVIRDDLVWSDGTPITAHDVEFSFKMIMNPKIPIPAVRTGMETIRWVEAYDDHTLVYFHKDPLATNVWNLNFPVVPKHIYEKSIDEDPTLADSEYHQKYEENPVCGGPYKMVKRLKGREIVLERREDWYMYKGKQVRSKPHFKTIRFRVIEDSNTALLALKGGKIEEMELQPEQWTDQTTDDDFYNLNTKARGEQWVYYYLGWNMQTPFFKDKRVRKAMSYSVDYDYILNTLCYGLYPQSTSEYHKDSWAGPVKPRTPYKQDLEKAAQLLDEAGWIDNDGDGIREKEINGKKIKFEFSIMCSTQQLRIDICTSLKESLGRIGVSCTVQPTEFTVMQERAREGKFQAQFAGWGTGADPYSTENLWKTGEQRNYVRYSNKEVDELFAKAKFELERDKRATYYRKIDDILWEAQPYTWLYYRSAFYGFSKDLRGYEFSPRGPYSYSPGFDSIYTEQ
ncbi:ABC transporter substrate-binding protein [Thalassoglobus polymorphus]|uniref:Oligopeptide-binding protein AppA n=1 Tax=Thalassoglobus polymorphus TaxID=2527994 RepID=A0A517QRP7_9PLAN|nr:ABC transporter substrate-binding protein [Thalassoglobus polymorphus]QDT34300.1 Oligopeptide-binding protein AppA precursor [Thalassoglobus polymorphus]